MTFSIWRLAGISGAQMQLYLLSGS